MFWRNKQHSAVETALRRALERDPGNAEALHLLSMRLAAVGRLNEALELREVLDELEPLVAVYRAKSAEIRLEHNLSDEVAFATLQELELTDPRNRATQMGHIARYYADRGQFEEAADTILSLEGGLFETTALEHAALLLRSAPMPVYDTRPLPPLLSFVYAYVGEYDLAMEYYERSLEDGGLSGGFDYTPIFAELRQTQRFKDYIRASGVYDYWVERGFADICRPVGVDDFECD